MQSFSFDFALNLFPLMLKRLNITLGMSLLSLLFGIIIAIIIAIIIQTKVKILYPLTKVYVSFFRGTPLITQLFFLYFGLPQLIPVLKEASGFTIAIMGLSLNSGAYMSEAIRGAISSVEKGQMEAALSVGMTYLQAMKRIILPQAARVAIPALSNSFINIIKGTALTFTIGVTEVMATAQMEGAAAYRYFEAFTNVIIIYWGIVQLFSYLQKKLEIKMNKAY
ncbi:amino acid ABC transporter permease [Acetohalobium arabaticum]|uniref:Amino acid ABC transporter membrane protein, PAAT family n=1 Tax=Acetohalobium arabaticum (strain ATCC 49924 / DSM 5501 / Z-7288) TaxID=574087 RepID=D9QUH1_ACEAZ|nr:amino acid ABC transporter permease [Acetohalobium arabaticum]ADL13772.1 amino acid ABC transporter membrane protein, PAAT family [Acetohalobium arabaticum DSM 5501]